MIFVQIKIKENKNDFLTTKKNKKMIRAIAFLTFINSISIYTLLTKNEEQRKDIYNLKNKIYVLQKRIENKK